VSIWPSQIWALAEAWAQVPHFTRPPCSLFSPVTVTAIGDGQYPPQLEPKQEPQGEPGFVDSSGPIFSMYLDMAEEGGKKMVESWKAEAEGILVFVRLYLLVPCLTLIHWA
jgi:hypothetical protein